MNFVSIITINYKGYATTVELLDSLHKYLEADTYKYEVIVVDNSPTDEDYKKLAANYSWIKLVRSENNGFSAGNNIGIKNSSGNFFFFVNNDVVIDSDVVKPLLERFDCDDRIGVVAPKIRQFDTGEIYWAGIKPLGKYIIRIHYYKDEDSFGRSFSTPYTLGTAMMISKAVVEDVGMWTEEFFLYDEELDYCLRIRNMNYDIWSEAKSVIFHKGSVATGKNSPLVHYYQTRNRLLIYKHHLKGIYKLLSMSFVILISIPQRCLRFARQGEKNLLKANLYGLFDFLRGKFGKSSRYS